MSYSVNVAIYDVYDQRDPNHWAICLRNNEGSVILQVGDDKGGVGYYVDEPMYNKAPERSARHKESIMVGSIQSKNFQKAISIIQKHPVDNVSTTWNCQAWAMEALGAIEDYGLFTWDESAKKLLESKRQRWQ